MNLKKDVLEIINWLSCAVEKLLALLKAKKTLDSAVLANDIKEVIGMYFQVFRDVVPEVDLKPWPKNFFSQLKWIKSNINWLNIVSSVFSGTNPFTEARAKAAEVAAKWEFYA